MNAHSTELPLRLFRPALYGLFAVALWLAAAAVRPAAAAELIMFEQQGCEWCEAWHKEIGPIYPKTLESHAAPLRRVSLEESMPADLVHVRGVHYTPTFVLMENGNEVGRILGYPGEEFFWSLLAMELGKLGHDGQAGRAGQETPDCVEDADGGKAYEKNPDRASAC